MRRRQRASSGRATSSESGECASHEPSTTLVRLVPSFESPTSCCSSSSSDASRGQQSSVAPPSERIETPSGSGSPASAPISPKVVRGPSRASGSRPGSEPSPPVASVAASVARWSSGSARHICSSPAMTSPNVVSEIVHSGHHDSLAIEPSRLRPPPSRRTTPGGTSMSVARRQSASSRGVSSGAKTAVSASTCECCRARLSRSAARRERTVLRCTARSVRPCGADMTPHGRDSSSFSSASSSSSSSPSSSSSSPSSLSFSAKLNVPPVRQSALSPPSVASGVVGFSQSTAPGARSYARLVLPLPPLPRASDGVAGSLSCPSIG